MSARSDTPARVPADPRRFTALALLCAVFLMVTVDASIVLVSVPAIGADLSFSPGALQWVMSAYMLSYGGLLLLGGRAADLLGRRRMLIAGTGLFALASLAAGLATVPATLIAARVVQGVAAAVMTPAALSILSETFAEGPERNRALGIWAATGGVGGAAAWLIGGVITDVLGWEWVFFINVPVAAAVALLSPVLLSESRDASPRRRFDVAGAATITAGLLALVAAITQAPTVGWGSARTLGLLALAAALAAAFHRIESRCADPLVPLGVLRSRSLAGGNLVLVAVGIVAFGPGFVLSEYAQRELGWSPSHFGLAFVAMPVMVAAGSTVGQSLAARRDATRAIAGCGLALVGVGMLVLSRISTHGGYLADVLPALVPYGLGIGGAYVIGSIASLAGVARADAGLASGLNNASFQLGGALGVAVLSTIAAADARGGGPAALTSGARSAFLVAAAFAVLGVGPALVLLGSRRRMWRRPGAPAPAGRSAGNGVGS